MIWIWRNPQMLPQKQMGEYIQGSGTDRFEFIEGIPIESQEVCPPKVIFKCSRKYLYDVLPNSGALLIVSKTVLDILNDLCPDDFQSFKANIFIDEKRIDDYFLLNITNKLEVIDKEQSIYSTFKNSNAISRFNKLVYKVDNFVGHDIVRNADYVAHVLVSDRLKETFEKLRIREVEFRQEP